MSAERTGLKAQLFTFGVTLAVGLLSSASACAGEPSEDWAHVDPAADSFFLAPAEECTKDGAGSKSICDPTLWSGRTCDPAEVASSLRRLSQWHPTNDSDERYFLSVCKGAMSALVTIGAQTLAAGDEMESLRRDNLTKPNDDKLREIVRTGERALRHAEAYLDGLRSMAASWCPNVSAIRDAIPDSENDLNKMRWGLDGLRRMTPGARSN